MYYYHYGNQYYRVTPRYISKQEQALNQLMRRLWNEHVAWTRMTVISIAHDLPDEQPVTERLLRNATDFGNAIRTYYGDQIASGFSKLLTDHLVIAAQYFKALKSDDQHAASDARTKWYKNADDIAVFLSSINPYWPQQAVRDMFYMHLKLLEAEMLLRLNKQYASDVAIYDQVEAQALDMADTFTQGIVRQFPAMFQ